MTLEWPDRTSLPDRPSVIVPPRRATAGSSYPTPPTAATFAAQLGGSAVSCIAP
jgi:hypothetical protein